jgi:anti-sigma factor RsiW
MNCENLQDWLHEYMDGSLDATAQVAADRHLAGCDACRRAVLREQQFAGRMSGQLRDGVANLTLRPEIRNRILKAAAGRPAAPGMLEIIEGWWNSYARMVAIPASVLLVAAFLLAAHFHSREARVYHTETIASISREACPAVAVEVSYQTPAYTFHREGNRVTDSLSDKTVTAQLVLR